MILDCFIFFNELDLLEIRLNSLAPYVDCFVLCEMPITHSGKPKPLYFAENRKRFSAFPIIHIIAEDDGTYESTGKMKGASWRIENLQREALMKGLTRCKPSDIVLVSDVDEIPNLEGYDGSEGVFKQKLYYYYLNCRVKQKRLWRGTQAIRYGHIESLNKLRDDRGRTNPAKIDGGWHFSFLGGADAVKDKIESYAHVEFDRDEVKGGIKDNMNSISDPLGRKHVHLFIEEPDGPDWLLANRNKYPHLFYEK